MKIVHIEDNATFAEMIERFINRTQMDPAWFIESFRTLQEGIDYINQHTDIDVLLLDLCLEDSEGISTFYRAIKEIPDMPIIVISGIGDKETAIAAVANGAQDYLLKGGLTRPIVARSIQFALARHKLRTQLHQELETSLQVQST